MKCITKAKASLLAVALGLITPPAYSASWYFMWAGNSDTKYFFDQDTVEKSQGIVTLWLKMVQARKADTDGSWATAVRWRINCPKRTIQNLAMSTYDANGKFIRSYNNAGTENSIIPDSTGEAVHRIACQSDFPRSKTEKDYLKVNDNDIYAATRRLVEWEESQKDSAPQ